MSMKAGLSSRPSFASIPKILRIAIGICLAAFFVTMIARQISLDDLQRAFATARPGWIFAALGAFGVAYSCRIERWRHMLVNDNPTLTWRICAGPFMASFAANNVLPLRAGDVLRSFAFNRELGVTSGVVVASLFVERLLDLLMVFGLLGISLAYYGLNTSHFSSVGSEVLAAAAIVVLFVLVFPRAVSPIALQAGKLISGWFPKIGPRFHEEIKRSTQTLERLSSGRNMLKLIAWSVAAWIAEGCVFWFAAFALPSTTVPAAAWLALPVGTLATLIPSTPGHVGTFDFFALKAMTLLGNSVAAGGAYVILVHAVLWMPPTIVGGLYLLLRPSATLVKEQDR